MRTSLFAIAFGALLLTGCADDLTGPDVAPLTGDASAARTADTFAPIEDEDAMSVLFSTWAGNDGAYSFRFTFEQAPAPDASDTFEALSGVPFTGKGSYERGSTIACRIVGKFVDGIVSFTIFDNKGTFAYAEGTLADDFASLDVKMEYADGTREAMSFKRDGNRFVATK